MGRVTGIGGIFIKSRDPERLKAWYRAHLGMDIQDWGGMTFQWSEGGATVWSVFDASSKYFEPSAAPFMVNYRVENLRAVLDALTAEGCAVEPKTEESEFGKFGWVVDPDGNKIELWEPPPGGIPA